MSDFQERLDQLIADLDLTLEEREFIHRNWKTNRTARRVMNLFGEVVQERPMDKRKVLLRHLFDAVQRLRVEIVAAHFVPPEGFVLVDEGAMEEFRRLAALQLEVSEMGATDPNRGPRVREIQNSARRAAQMDAGMAGYV